MAFQSFALCVKILIIIFASSLWWHSAMNWLPSYCALKSSMAHWWSETLIATRSDISYICLGCHCNGVLYKPPILLNLFLNGAGDKFPKIWHNGPIHTKDEAKQLHTHTFNRCHFKADFTFDWVWLGDHRPLGSRLHSFSVTPNVPRTYALMWKYVCA